MLKLARERHTALAPNPDHEKLLTPVQLGKRWNKATKTLANMRSGGSGVPFIKLGERGSVRYRLSDVQAFENKQERLNKLRDGMQ